MLPLRHSLRSNFGAFVLHVFYISLWHTRRTHPQPCPDSMGTRLATLQSVPSAPLGSPCPEAPHRAVRLRYFGAIDSFAGSVIVFSATGGFSCSGRVISLRCVSCVHPDANAVRSSTRNSDRTYLFIGFSFCQGVKY